MEKKKSTLSNYMLLIAGFTLLFIILMMFQSCSCDSNQPTQIVIGEKPAPVVIIDSLQITKEQDWTKYYRKLYVKESGMRYVIYTTRSSNDFHIVNITKDSLDCLIAKQRLEIINKYN